MMTNICCLVTEKSHVKLLKTHLEELGLFNKRFRITKTDEGFAIPVTFETVSHYDGNTEKYIYENIKETISCPFSIQHIYDDKLLSVKVKKPYEKLYEFVSSYMNTRKVNIDNSQNVQTELPKKWESHGDLIMFPDSAFSSPYWNTLSQDFWQGIADLFSVKRIAVTSRIHSDGYRTPVVMLRLGDDGWVKHIDNGITYTYDVTKNMFSKGNITEKLRISKFDCSNEIVMDLFAGIGYFVLPYLVKANAKKVIACEWNPDAVLALSQNLALNNVSNRCEIKKGDNRVVAPKDVSDRVNLGLIPTSSGSWQVGCDALKRNTGGWLHIHENVESRPVEANENVATPGIDMRSICCCEVNCIVTETYSSRLSETKRVAWCHFVSSCLRKLRIMFETSGHWSVNLRHIEYVKSYAPHIDHVVLDVECRPEKTLDLNPGLPM